MTKTFFFILLPNILNNFYLSLDLHQTVTVMLGCDVALVFWVLGGARQVSWEPGPESGLLLLSHQLLICPYQDTFLGVAGAASLRQLVSLS